MLNTIEQFVRPEIHSFNAYPVGETTNAIKLDNMENPDAWDQSVVDDWRQRLKLTPINRYPDAEAGPLHAKLREVMGIPDNTGMKLGNGSVELIQMVCMALAKPGATVLAPNPTFGMYKMLAFFANMDYRPVDLNDDFSLNMPAMMQAIEETQPAVVFLSYPYNPAGNLIEERDVCQIIDANPGLVVMGEAYFASAGDSFAKYLDQYNNLMIMRAVSKMGLAGLRLGYMMGNPAWINEFNKVRSPFNINSLTQVSAEFALENRAMFETQTDETCQARDSLYASMKKINATQCCPSQANFILVKPKIGQGNHLFDALKKVAILIRNLGTTVGLLANCLRVTVGTKQENAVFLQALQENS